MSERPIRVAVIGGGCAAMTAAWELTKPEHGGKFDVTVFQEGWRLGGKGASGRGPSGRIEEHGLHIWLGFYDNAFRMMRECHAELDGRGLGALYGDWRDAWTPKNDVALCSAAEGGGFQRWMVRMPPRAGLPGDPRAADEPFDLQYYLSTGFDMMRAVLLDMQVDGHGVVSEFDPRGAGSDLGGRLLAMVRMGLFASAATVAEAAGLLAVLVRSVTPASLGNLLVTAESAAAWMRQWIEDRWIADSKHRYLWEIADLTLASLVGTLRHGVLFNPRGLEVIDDYEVRTWLRMNGASIRALQSPFVRGLFDLSMGYVGGDPDKPSLSAGQGLRGLLRTFFGYRGAFMWRMRAGMGDVVFAPLYTAMLERGAKFRFFHRLTDVVPGEDGDHVAALTFDVQARIKGGKDYAPLFDVKGRPCWPSQPDLDQLVGGRKIAAEGWNFESHWDRRRDSELTLRVGEDFDMVVLGVGLGAIPHVAPKIVARDPRWRAMCDNVTTVASQAFQIWLDEDLAELGWPGPAYITGAFAKPFDTWCDMAHVVPEEDWRSPPRASVYFCSVLRDPPQPPGDGDIDYPARRAEEVRESAEQFLLGPMKHLWPGAFGADGDFRWDILKAPDGEHDPEPPSGRARFGTQYWRANVNPSDRYVIHPPGSWRYRISPLDMSYDNLTLAGDWTDSGFHSGCVEGAVMSGLLAAHALSGLPLLEEIIAYDHP